jgi:hypothetical protein
MAEPAPIPTKPASAASLDRLSIGAAAALGTILGLRQLGGLISVVFLTLLLAILVHPLVVIMIVSLARLATLLPACWFADFEVGEWALEALTAAVSVDQAAGRLLAALRSVTSFVPARSS